MNRLAPLLTGVIAATAIWVIAPSSAGAATIVPDTHRDNDSAQPGDCTLRRAISAANQNSPQGGCPAGDPGRDVIRLNPWIYQLTLDAPSEDLNASGDLDVREDLLMSGVLPDGTHGGTVVDAGRRFRILHTPTEADVEIRRTRLSGGDVDPGIAGGGLLVGPGSRAVLDDSRIVNSFAHSGGGVAVDGLGATLVVRNRSHIRGSTENGNGPEAGGGIFLGQGSVSIHESSVGGDAPTGFGGAIAVLGGTLSMNRSLIDFAQADTGGGIFAGLGSGTASLLNSTIFHAEASDSADAISATEGAEVSLTSVTIASDEPSAAPEALATSVGATISLRNTIVTHDAAICSGSVISRGHNLLNKIGGCTVSGLRGSDKTNVAPRLNLDRDHHTGGRTWSAELRRGSPAINAGARGVPRVDQRGAPRPRRTDIGAHERVFCGGVLVRWIGTPGRDVFNGSHRVAMSDGVLGLGGPDVLTGGAGRDGLCGGPGRDALRGSRGDDRLIGGPGADRIFGGPGNDRGLGGPGIDRLAGHRGADLLFGGSQRDFLYGGGQNDRLYGQRGPDRLFGQRGNDLLIGGPGLDVLRGGPGRNRLQQ